jgi:hypothetical protein
VINEQWGEQLERSAGAMTVRFGSMLSKKGLSDAANDDS